MNDEELDEIRAVAERQQTTVSEWVRTVLREERERERRGTTAGVRETTAAYGVPSSSGRVRVELDLKRDLLEAVRARYRLPSDRAAVEYALRRAAVTPMSKDEVLEMQGVGWDGDLDALRSGDPGAEW
jgi:Arc/MetJ family transcription regulator